MLPGAADGDGREVQLSDGVGGRLQCCDHLTVEVRRRTFIEWPKKLPL